MDYGARESPESQVGVGLKRQIHLCFTQAPNCRKKMEPIGALCEGEWSSFNGMFSTEEADFMAQLLANYSLPSEQDWESSMGVLQSTSWPCHEAASKLTRSDDGLYSNSDTFNFYSFPEGTSYNSDNSSFFFPALIHENYHMSDYNQAVVKRNDSMSTDFCMVNEKNTYSSVPDDIMEEQPMCLNEDVANPDKKLQHKRKSEMPILNVSTEVKNNANPLESPNKKTRISEVQRNKKNVQSKKKKKLVLSTATNDEEEGNGGMNGQSSSSYCSEDDSNASQEINEVATTSSSKGFTSINLIGKTRASRGSATDPQSLYARKRRERINERLRILQNLVPNGTKVDISTMLDEAVQYVKFLQVQIKLLSSDDLWMYAPIAYGMDIGLNLKISPPC